MTRNPDNFHEVCFDIPVWELGECSMCQRIPPTSKYHVWSNEDIDMLKTIDAVRQHTLRMTFTPSNLGIHNPDPDAAVREALCETRTGPRVHFGLRADPSGPVVFCLTPFTTPPLYNTLRLTPTPLCEDDWGW